MEYWIERGREKYDRFIDKIGYMLPVMTPHSGTLESLGVLDESSDSFIRIAAIEFAKNFDD